MSDLFTRRCGSFFPSSALLVQLLRLRHTAARVPLFFIRHQFSSLLFRLPVTPPLSTFSPPLSLHLLPASFSRAFSLSKKRNAATTSASRAASLPCPPSSRRSFLRLPRNNRRPRPRTRARRTASLTRPCCSSSRARCSSRDWFRRWSPLA